MSSIIKGGRIRNQSIIDFGERYTSIKGSEESIQLNQEDNSLLLEKSQESIQDTNQLAEIEEEIQRRLAQADIKAEEILSEALKRAQYIESDANAKKADMLFKMNEEKEAILAQAYKKAKEIEEQAEARKKQIIASSEEEVVETIIVLLQHIVNYDLEGHTQWVNWIVKKMLEDEQVGESIKIILSPNLYKRLNSEEVDRLTQLKKEVEIETSESLSDTTCRVETKLGSISYDVYDGLDRVISDMKMLKDMKQRTL